MRPHTASAALGLALLLSSGCAYDNYYSFANTRKLVDSDAPQVTKAVFAPMTLLFEGMYSPITAWMDAQNYAKDKEHEKEHVYLSYIGAKSLYDSDMHVMYKIAGSFMVLPIDTVWFPVAGVIDTVYALSDHDTDAEGPEKDADAPEQKG